MIDNNGISGNYVIKETACTKQQHFLNYLVNYLASVRRERITSLQDGS